MGQPHLLDLGAFCHIRRLQKGHVLVFPGLVLFFRFAVHTLANEQIGFGGIFYDSLRGPGICTIGELNSFSGRPHNHIRGEHVFRGLDGFPFLQTAPILFGDIQCLGFVQLETAASFNDYTIAVADYIMVHAEGFNTEAFKIYAVLRLCQFHIFNRKRKFGSDDTKGIYHTGKPLGAYQKKRFCPFCIPHGEKHSRKAADMVGVIMGKADNIHRLRAPALFLHGNLCSLAAVDHNTFSIVTGHEGGQPPVGQGHHPSGSQ